MEVLFVKPSGSINGFVLSASWHLLFCVRGPRWSWDEPKHVAVSPCRCSHFCALPWNILSRYVTRIYPVCPSPIYTFSFRKLFIKSSIILHQSQGIPDGPLTIYCLTLLFPTKTVRCLEKTMSWVPYVLLETGRLSSFHGDTCRNLLVSFEDEDKLIWYFCSSSLIGASLQIKRKPRSTKH